MRAVRFALVAEPVVEPHAARDGPATIGVDAAPGVKALRSSEGWSATRAAIAIALGQASHGPTEVHVPVVLETHVAVEVHRILEPQPGRVPGLPVVAVDLGPPVNAARISERQSRPGAP